MESLADLVSTASFAFVKIVSDIFMEKMAAERVVKLAVIVGLKVLQRTSRNYRSFV